MRGYLCLLTTREINRDDDVSPKRIEAVSDKDQRKGKFVAYLKV